MSPLGPSPFADAIGGEGREGAEGEREREREREREIRHVDARLGGYGAGAAVAAAGAKAGAASIVISFLPHRRTSPAPLLAIGPS